MSADICALYKNREPHPEGYGPLYCHDQGSSSLEDANEITPFLSLSPIANWIIMITRLAVVAENAMRRSIERAIVSPLCAIRIPPFCSFTADRIPSAHLYIIIPYCIQKCKRIYKS